VALSANECSSNAEERDRNHWWVLTTGALILMRHVATGVFSRAMKFFLFAELYYCGDAIAVYYFTNGLAWTLASMP
jgi:hypothetical protein